MKPVKYDEVRSAAVELGFFERFVDGLVLANACAVGFEVDQRNNMPGLFDALCWGFWVLYGVEFAWRLGAGRSCLKALSRLLWLEFFIVAFSVVGTFALYPDKLAWRLSVLRVVRFLRIPRDITKTYQCPLWLTVAGKRPVFVPFVSMCLLLCAATLMGGDLVRQLLLQVVDADHDAGCVGSDFRLRLKCLDVSLYFGSIWRAAGTFFQAATRDCWAAHVVRPLMKIDFMVGLVALLFVLASSYGVLSVGIGIFIWSTVQVSTRRADFKLTMAALEDHETIQHIRDYFYMSLMTEDRVHIGLKELEEAMKVPEVRDAFERLDLPVTSVPELFDLLDEEHIGEISLDSFEEVCQKLKEPAGRVDMACLMARVEGGLALSCDLCRRSDDMVRDLDCMCRDLHQSFAQLKELIFTDEVVELNPEIRYRRNGQVEIENL